jgi:hypothetical protein
MDHYLDLKTYRRLVRTLAKLKPCPLTGDLENPVKIALGEDGDVWPASIQAQANIREG